MFRSILFSLVCLFTTFSFAGDDIPSMYRIVAEENRVPTKLFYAQMLNESRSPTSHKLSTKVLPWPWTINHRGKAHYFPTRHKAYSYAKALLEKGDKQFDVGLGQINWYWHAERFNSLWEAFNPYTNLTVAAQYLREQYERKECNSWELAVGCYHRPGQRPKDKQIAKKYAKRVISLWAKI